jgi:uncharacterized membrane protein
MITSLLITSLFACGGAQQSSQNASPARAPSADLATCATRDFAAVRPIVNKRCTACHSPTGMAGEDYDWTKDSALIAHRQNVVAQVEQGSMPPSGYPRLSAEERHTLLCWAKPLRAHGRLP